jgi:hypothetical protein
MVEYKNTGKGIFCFNSHKPIIGLQVCLDWNENSFLCGAERSPIFCLRSYHE